MSKSSETNNILVDTDILIDYSNGKSKILEDLFQKHTLGLVSLYISPVTVAEFLTDNKLKNESKQKDAEEFLGLFEIIDVGKKEGVMAGKLLRQGHPPFLGDALIASICLVNNFMLATRNAKHFSKVKGLQFTPSQSF